jgi:hypothetical protein
MFHKILRSAMGAAVVFGLLFCQETRVLAGSTGEITGRVTDATTNAPIAGASVSAISYTGTYKATSDAKGYFAIVNVFPDTYRITATAAGYQTGMSDGNTVDQNNSTVVNIALAKQTTVLGRVTVRGATTVVQPNVTPDQYVLTAAASNATNGSGGSYGLYQTPGIIGTLPGVTLDAGGYSHIRGSRLEEVGYEYDGLTTVEPVTGTFSTNLVEDGIARLQVSTGGYDASGGNAISGEVNTVVGVGSYPARGSVTSLIQSPTFYHGLNFDYGSATPDGRFSWYAASVMWNSGYDWGKRGSFVAGPESSETAFGGGPLGSVIPSRDEVLNVHYKFGTNFDNDVQFLATTGIEHYNNTILATTFPSSNPVDGPISQIPQPVNGICDAGGVPGNGFALFPGQTSCTETPGAGTTDHDDQGYFIDKLQLTHNFSSNATLAVHYARVGSYVTFSFPFGDGPFGSFWENRHSDQQEGFAEYTVQANNQNLIKVGGDTIYSTNWLLEVLPQFDEGIVIPTNNHDTSYWIADNFKVNDKLTLDLSGRRDSRTYYRVLDSTFTDSANQARGGFAYQLNQATVIRGSDGNFVELPFMSRVEEDISVAPNFYDYKSVNFDVRKGAMPDVPQSHSYDYSFEHDFGQGIAVKVGPFYRKTDNLILTFKNPGQPAALPQAAGPYYVNGFESELQFNHLGNGLAGYINYTHTRALAEITGDYNQSLPVGAQAYKALFPVGFVPPNVANLVLTIHRDKWSINPEINWYGGYPYGVGQLTYNNQNCPNGTGGGDPTKPCGAIVNNPAAYLDTNGGLCGPGFCTKLIDPNESKFADGRVCCSTLTANLNIYYNVNPITQVGIQWENLNQNYRPIALEQNPYYPSGFNGFFNYGTAPYIPASINNSQEFLFTITQKI